MRERERVGNIKLEFWNLLYLLPVLTALTAGGSNDTEIATPTTDPKFSLNTAIALAAPVGNAVSMPNNNE